MKSGSLPLMSIAAILLTGCPLPPYGDGPPPGCQGPGCYGDDDDDGCGGWSGSGGTGGYAGSGGKAGSGGYGGGQPDPPRPRIGLDEYLQRLRLDAQTVPRFEQADLVYVDLHALYNSERYADDELAAAANATLKLLNQLDVFSTSPTTSGAAVILDDNNRPLAVRFNPARFNLDKVNDVERFIIRPNDRQDISNLFSCAIPSIPLLDFVHKGASDDVFNVFGNEGDGTVESAYSNIALRKLLVQTGFLNEDQLVFDPISREDFIANGFTSISNVNLYQALEALDPNNFNRGQLDLTYNGSNDNDSANMVRGALLNSGVSAANRVVDRLPQGSGSFGTTYLTFDVLAFNNPGDNSDIFEARFIGPGNPPGDPLVRPFDGFLPFEAVGGEGIYQLPNQMLGYLMFNANFNLITRLPSDVVFDGSEQGSAISSASCNGCHSRFTIPFTDAMLPAIIAGEPGEVDSFGYALKRAQPQNDWDFTFENDAQIYADALRNVYFATDEFGDLPDGVSFFSKTYQNDLSLEDIVDDLGLPDVETLIDRIKDNTDILADLAEGSISRENYVANYQVFVEQVAGQNEDFLRGCVAREVEDTGDFDGRD
jgi:hypothetical protein